MSDLNNKGKLLNDVLAETSPADFREALLGETLRLARRRRRWRQMRQAAGVFAVAALLVILGWQNWPTQSVASKPIAKKTVRTNYKLVRTQPLPEIDLITTRQSSVQIVASISAVAQISTTSGGFRQINDNELLALLAGKPAVLIRTGPHSEELVFANPIDQKGFPIN